MSQTRRSLQYIEKIHSPDEGWYFLCADVIRPMRKKWDRVKARGHHDKEWKECINFFLSDTFDNLCAMSRIDPEAALDRLGIKWRYNRDRT